MTQASALPQRTIEQHHIDIYLVEPQSLSSDILSQYQQIISREESDKAQKKYSDNGKRDALITRGLVRSVLSQYADIDATDWQFDKGWNGKPFIQEVNSQPTELEFNLSHAHQLIALAITKSTPVGIDVEYTKRKSDTKKLAPRYFSAAETAALQSLPDDEQQSGFYDYWTLKESYIKACGDGLAAPLHQFSFDVSDKENIVLSIDEARDDNSDHWHSKLYTVSDDHKMALTVNTSPQTPLNVRLFKLNENGVAIECQLPF